MNILDYLIDLILALAVVIVLILLLVPFFIKRYFHIRTSGEKVKIKRIIPVSRSIFIVEMEIENTFMVVIMSENFAEVIYKEEIK